MLAGMFVSLAMRAGHLVARPRGTASSTRSEKMLGQFSETIAFFQSHPTRVSHIHSLALSDLRRSVSMIFYYPQDLGQAFDRRFRNIASRFTSLLGIYNESAICTLCSSHKPPRMRFLIRFRIKLGLSSPDPEQRIPSELQS